jgi:hypothetical protein
VQYPPGHFFVGVGSFSDFDRIPHQQLETGFGKLKTGFWTYRKFKKLISYSLETLDV